MAMNLYKIGSQEWKEQLLKEYKEKEEKKGEEKLEMGYGENEQEIIEYL